MYALILLFAFILLPLAYFFFEEKDDDKRTSTGKVMPVYATLSAPHRSSVYVWRSAILQASLSSWACSCALGSSADEAL